MPSSTPSLSARSLGPSAAGILKNVLVSSSPAFTAAGFVRGSRPSVLLQFLLHILPQPTQEPADQSFLSSLALPPSEIPSIYAILLLWARSLHVSHPSVLPSSSSASTLHDPAVYSSRWRFADARVRSLNLCLGGGAVVYRRNRHTTGSERTSRISRLLGKRSSLPLEIAQELTSARVRGKPVVPGVRAPPSPADPTQSQSRSLASQRLLRLSIRSRRSSSSQPVAAPSSSPPSVHTYPQSWPPVSFATWHPLLDRGGRTLLAARSIPTYCALCRLLSPHRYCPLRSATVCSSCVPLDCPCCSPALSAVPDGRMHPPLLASAMLSSSMFSSVVRRPAVKIVSLEQFAVQYSPSTTFCQGPTSTMWQWPRVQSLARLHRLRRLRNHPRCLKRQLWELSV